MADWLVYQEGGAHLGPFSAEVIAQGIAEGRLPQGIFVALPGGPRWLRAIDLPLLAELVKAAAAKPLVDGARAKPDMSAFAATMNLSEDDVELSEIRVGTPAISSIPPPLPNALRSTMVLPSSPPLPRSARKNESLGGTLVLANGPASDQLRRRGS
jgi:hypothetical protein